jgi:hypothetical protein
MAGAVVMDRRSEMAQRHGVAVATLDEWRSWGWLEPGGGAAGNAGDGFSWEDPEADAQVNWLATVRRWTTGPDEHDAAAGPWLRTSGCVSAYRIAGTTDWVPLVGANLDQFGTVLGGLKSWVTVLAVRPPVGAVGVAEWEPWG